MSAKICPFLSANGPRQECITDACMLYVEGRTSSHCAMVKLPTKTVIRLDTLSAQIQEIQILLNQLSNS